MKIACTLQHETISDKDRAGRPYTLALTHYREAETGQLIRTRGRVINAMSAPNPTPSATAEEDRPQPATSQANFSETGVYLDSQQNPAFRLSFGWSQYAAKTTEVLAVGESGVCVIALTPAQFDAEFTASSVPERIAAHALNSLARERGITREARHALLFHRNAPAWRLRLSVYELAARAFVHRLYTNFF
ncbi:hypothetical protein [Paraburkholderia dioscoreae]|uniref:Uncharacterized protein n=1 Tax=Paraburkholderia dioscoreae TaxID=2604047 RepID=A0A5Q4YWQ3_9BURK|nr:hypothetical protein [Paraburkholderia dioscoreae]VVD30982.1 conserved protein of unknown function [Paraburkholderia dioscoreae]